MPIAKLNGQNISYQTFGEGKPIVLCHGYTASSQMWSHQIPAFAENHQVIAYDARGHGLSSSPAGRQSYSLANLVEDLRVFLDYMGIQKAYLIGHSMGGATVAAFAHQYPNKTLATLICNIDAGHQPPSDKVTQAQFLADRERKHLLVKEWGLVDYARQQIANRVAPSFVCDDPYEQIAYIERYARQSENGFLGVGLALPWREPWLTAASAGLEGPVAIIAGTDDVMHVGAELLHKKLPQSRFISLKDAPHDSVNARPKAFESAVLNFLQDVENNRPLAGYSVL